MFFKNIKIKKIIYLLLFLMYFVLYNNWLLFVQKRNYLVLNYSDNFVIENYSYWKSHVSDFKNNFFLLSDVEYSYLLDLYYKYGIIDKQKLIDLITELECTKWSLRYLDDLYFLSEVKTFKLNFLVHYVLSSLFLIIGLLIAVAFFTLFERKVMAAMQRRKGPNVVGFWGLLQPLADGVKLLIKEIVIPKKASVRFFLGSPLYTFLMSLLGWCVIPWSDNVVFSDPRLSALYVFAVSSLGVYGVLLAGWSSNSKYAFLGGLRSAAQMISYEVSLGFILVIVALFSGSYNLREIVYKQENVWYCFPLFPLVLIFFVSMLAETNRAPFDLPEAEAELVSGYNTEYSSIIFAMFFLGEYSSMLLMAAILVIFFFGGWLPPLFLNFEIFEGFWFALKIAFVAFLYVWVRATLPRYRYNQLMSIGWKIFLPVTFGLLILYAGLLLFFNGLPDNLEYNNTIFEVSFNIKDKKDIFFRLKDL